MVRETECYAWKLRWVGLVILGVVLCLVSVGTDVAQTGAVPASDDTG